MIQKEINGFSHIKYESKSFNSNEMIDRSKSYFEWSDQRRSVREISSKNFPIEVIENIIKTASTAPSGAHKQPWTFCVIASPDMKQKIRAAAEEEEKVNYGGRMSEKWKEDLLPFATDWKKPFLEESPYLIVVFKRVFELGEEGTKINNYYVNESVGIACGMLISAIHNAGLVTLTHTPSPMNFLTEILERPENERPFLLLPVGYPSDDTYVPLLKRKKLDEVMITY
ncbi:MAG: nitroreductase family protein [Reichenbachiella sp.]